MSAKHRYDTPEGKCRRLAMDKVRVVITRRTRSPEGFVVGWAEVDRFGYLRMEYEVTPNKTTAVEMLRAKLRCFAEIGFSVKVNHTSKGK